MPIKLLHSITFTPSPLELEMQQRGGNWLVTLTGDREKVLYEGLDRTKAQKLFDEVKQSYVAREAAEKA